MSRLLLPLATATLLLAGTASAGSFTGTIDAVGASLINTVEGTSDLTSSIGDDKVVLEARDDAARFVASDGEQRGAQLEAALGHIRTRAPALQASDRELAEAILAN